MMRENLALELLAGCMVLLSACAIADDTVRARDLGVPFDGTPGANNAITDVDGVLVGHTTLIAGNGAVEVGTGPIRTGVTAVLPLGMDVGRSVAAGRAVINGTGEMTGSWVIDELGTFAGPVMLTGTTSLGVVHHATSRWIRDTFPPEQSVAGLIPVVAETLDSNLNDIWGYHVKDEHVFDALNGASNGPVAEGNVGGGTGMVAYRFKGGIGTSSRVITVGEQTFTVGVLLQANHGGRNNLRIAGVPVGNEIPDLMPSREPLSEPKSSLVIIIGTDAPLTPTMLERVARRASLGVGRNGSIGSYMSGEIVLAFSTTNTTTIGAPRQTPDTVSAWDGATLNPLFQATVQAVEEALVNCLVAARTMTGANNTTIHALPHDRLRTILDKYNRLVD